MMKGGSIGFAQSHDGKGNMARLFTTITSKPSVAIFKQA